MRLTCPNCDAQYEVPDNVVPIDGRDVQCSNCGQTWFQHHPDHMPEDDTDDVAAQDEETDAPEETAEDDIEEGPVDAKSDTRADDRYDADDEGEEDDDFDDDYDDDASAKQAPPPAPTPTDNPGLDDLDDLPDATVQQAPARKPLDPAVADILREEAAAEQSARTKEATTPLESQPDLGLEEGDTDPDDRGAQARDRMARLRGEPEPMREAELNAAAISSRRDLLPDIDEINSTLRSDTDRSSKGPHAKIDAPSTTKRKRSFRSGFALMLLLIALLTLLYVYAPQIAQTVPQVDPYLSAYVNWVNGVRVWLDGQVQSLLSWLAAVADRSGS